MSTPSAKRPYVRPRIGRSVLRPLWYVAAVAGVLLVALVLPRTPPVLPALEGSWELRAEAGVDGLPPGNARLLVAHGRYSLLYEADAPSGPRGLELGDVQEDGSGVLLTPLQASYRDGSGAWRTELPPPRRLWVERNGQRLVLSDGEGQRLEGVATGR